MSHLKNCYCKRATHVVLSDKLRRHPELVHLMANNPLPQSLPRGREVKKLASPFTLHPSLKHKAAFTLAEVLITLGIIAVVAALTIPALINNFNHKALEAQFKKSVSTISQVVIKTKTDMGIDNLTEYCTYYNSTDQRYKNLAKCYKNLYNNYLMLNEKQNNYTGTLHGITRKDTIKTYNGKQDFAFDNGNSSTLTTPIHFPTVMPDGSYLNFHINESQMNIGVDINGGKKPNKLGHDIFIFRLNKQNDFLTSLGKPQNLSDEEIANGDYDSEYVANRAGNPCNLDSNQKGNGIGCAYYALMNKCPYDDSKTYFECLP